ncbi:MAG: pyridoxamine 5'-phosphate oxidase [Phycisphaerales bacterium]
MEDFSSIRREYHAPALHEQDLGNDPITAVSNWLREAIESQLIHEPTAMTLATVDEHNQPSARVVLMKTIDADGFVFCTNYESRKASDIDHNPRVTLMLYLDRMYRQIRIEGRVARVSAAESDAYFAARPRGAQIGAWASHQSAVIADRSVMQQKEAAITARFEGQNVPRPDFWGGYRVTPALIEFWQGQPNRLHDRICFSRVNAQTNQWQVQRLSP